MTDKSKNQVHFRWLPLLNDFQRCHGMSWGSTVLAWMYHSLFSTTHRDTIDIAKCTPLSLLDIPKIFSVVSTQETGSDVSHGRELNILLHKLRHCMTQQSRDQYNQRAFGGVYHWISYS
ncbi:hypothetical protein Ahy_B10g102259 [Arachis hypogaea]|uniref:Aminotransferase-like plant mobile domain-containing protein n=1 Tax=Arachis hypogaea TaxID=3818 RepID=A0A444X1G8_ARAHY|nr:hypothetical protein Ahy_B10g102259 [Arachis hypogaea]